MFNGARLILLTLGGNRTDIWIQFETSLIRYNNLSSPGNKTYIYLVYSTSVYSMKGLLFLGKLVK